MTTLAASQLNPISSTYLSSDSSRDALRQALHKAVADEIIRRQEITRIVSALARADIKMLLLKGAPLAYLIYPHPWLRPSCDIDLFIPAQDRIATREVFRACGYRPAIAVSGEVVSHQFSLLGQGSHGHDFNFDIHWKISNPQAFCNMLTLDEMLAQRLAVPEFGMSAYGPSLVHALQHALIHRVAHFAPANRMIWLYDIHLLIQRLNEQQWQKFVDGAVAKGIGAVCLDGIEASLALFGENPGALPSSKIDELKRLIEPEREIATSSFLRREIGQATRFRSDLAHLNWPDRLKLVREHLFPPVDYMQRRYGNDNAIALPLLYVYRILRGIFNAICRCPRAILHTIQKKIFK